MSTRLEQGWDGQHKQGWDGQHKQGWAGQHEQGWTGQHKQGWAGQHKQGWDGQHKQGWAGQHKQGWAGQHEQGWTGQHKQGWAGQHKQGWDGQHKQGWAGQHKQGCLLLSLFITSPLLNNIIETRMNDIAGPTMLLTHDNNVVQALFRQQPCNSLWDFYVCTWHRGYSTYIKYKTWETTEKARNSEIYFVIPWSTCTLKEY